MVREFGLSPPGSGRGLSCDANGAFVGTIPLLSESFVSGKIRWRPQDSNLLAKQIGAVFGLPIDLTSKRGGLKAICNALNEGDVARAQAATVLLGIPVPPPLTKGARSRADIIKFIRELHWSGMIKADWNPDEHPRWPARTPDGQGGRFAPKESSQATGLAGAQPGSGGKPARNQNLRIPIAASSRDDISHNSPGRKSEEECERQYDADMYVCGSLRDKQERAICRSSATQRYAACLSGKPLPPLALPDPESNFATRPAPSPSRRWPSGPPAWLPLLFIPFFFGVPA